MEYSSNTSEQLSSVERALQSTHVRRWEHAGTSYLDQLAGEKRHRTLDGIEPME
jgi:hypothetical protein